MRRRTISSSRVLPGGTPLRNRLLAALPAGDYHRICEHLRMNAVRTGETLQEHGARISHVYFPNGGVYSITNRDAGRRSRGSCNGRERGDAGHRGVLRRSLGSRPRLPTGRKWSAASDAGGSASSRKSRCPGRFARSSACTRRRTSCRQCRAPRATPYTT